MVNDAIQQDSMAIGGFHIDQANSDEDHLYIDVNAFTVIINREEDGIIVDIYPLCVADEPLVSAHAFHSESTQPNGRLYSVAPALLAACRMVVDRWERGDLAEAARACQAAIDEYDEA